MARRNRRPKSYVSRWLVALRARSAKFGVVQPDFTPAMKRRVRHQLGKKCGNCGVTPRRLHFDHHKPLCRGYPLVFGNVFLLCPACNYAKGTKMPADFYDAATLRKIEKLLADQLSWADD